MGTPANAPPGLGDRLVQGSVLVLGVLFVVSALAKTSPVEVFEIALINQGVVEVRLHAMWLARAIIAVELMLGFALLLRVHTTPVVKATAALTVVFSLHLALLMATGYTGDCGCLGDLVTMTPGLSLAKNLVILGLAAVSWCWPPTARRNSTWWLIGIMVITSAGVALLLPVRDLPPASSVDLAKFRFVREDGTKVDLLKGRCLVAFMTTDCDACIAMGEQLSDYREDHEDGQVVMAFLGTDDLVLRYFKRIMETFPYAVCDPAVFFGIVEKEPPRIYLLQDGKIVNQIEGKKAKLVQEFNRRKPTTALKTNAGAVFVAT